MPNMDPKKCPMPIQFLKALLPDPASLGPRTKGKTNIGCIFTGKKDGKEKTAIQTIGNMSFINTKWLNFLGLPLPKWSVRN